jgi:hypothetical protein
VVAVLDAGAGAAAVLARPVTGQVVSVHRRAAYLRLDGVLIALVGPGVHPGPLHVRCTALPALRAGEAVTGDGTALAGRDWAVRGTGPVWWGALPDAASLAAGADAAGVRSVTVPMAGRAGPLERRGFAGVGDLAAAVGGRGPGLTPAGDDLLAGVLLVARLAGGGGSQDGLDAVAARVSTTEIASAFLTWAARGQSIAPAHDWLVAVAAGDGPGAARALARLVAVGADSGRHLAAGLALGVGQLPRVASQTARAATSPGLRH